MSKVTVNAPEGQTIRASNIPYGTYFKASLHSEAIGSNLIIYGLKISQGAVGFCIVDLKEKAILCNQYNNMLFDDYIEMDVCFDFVPCFISRFV